MYHTNALFLFLFEFIVAKDDCWWTAWLAKGEGERLYSRERCVGRRTDNPYVVFTFHIKVSVSVVTKVEEMTECPQSNFQEISLLYQTQDRERKILSPSLWKTDPTVKSLDKVAIMCTSVRNTDLRSSSSSSSSLSSLSSKNNKMQKNHLIRIIGILGILRYKIKGFISFRPSTFSDLIVCS